MEFSLLLVLAFCVAVLLATIHYYERRTADLQEQLDYARASAVVRGRSA